MAGLISTEILPFPSVTYITTSKLKVKFWIRPQLKLFGPQASEKADLDHVAVTLSTLTFGTSLRCSRNGYKTQ